ncbi:uncharacterized protein LOC128243617 [Mya arenaria]|uniref:uncharacterized protein LOC128243617 n=1 Tax=Mya arenaria TaxID=6604 RepID=UPI0022E7118B|nr:uncharacterized protein LOC128243617 [Mya arenaria]XP_052817451.1 uncharacterized protein LOC128243617 [Mya arenaria]XP_052817452.1 uncharacterized protein LOC128243617 [Mya arenaria]XP_052817453.1 uncharacterized protein LOC128243617 [Mya arenaria]XP_052817454.1 uncharacterized protein LOC128243617 [Mya arenaria]
MSHEDQLKNKLYRNWVKSSLALKYLKDGLEGFVDDQASLMHDAFLTYLKGQLGTPGNLSCNCNLCDIVPHHCVINQPCRTANPKNCNCKGKSRRKGCPKSMCGVIYDLIVDEHQKKDPIWSNTDSSKWLSDHWEIAKCFLSITGYKSTGLEDMDSSGLLSICINCRYIASAIANMRNFEQARDLRNTILHSGTYEFQDYEVQTFIAKMIDVLSDGDVLSKDVNALAAIENLKKLQMEDFCISSQEADAMCASAREENYLKLKLHLEEDLKSFNRKHHSSVPLSSFLEENEVPLAELYVQPALFSVESLGSTFEGLRSKERRKVKSLHEIFHNQSKRCNEIYLSADAGLGKTVYAKYLANLWCDSIYDNKESVDLETTRSFEPDDLETIRKFDFVFIILLRECLEDECDVDVMLYNQVISQLPRLQSYSLAFIERVLICEQCLIVLDGLDEWTHPERAVSKCQLKESNIPHRKPRAKCTILTTTRPWKIDVINLKTSQIDRHIEIAGIESKASEELIQNVILKFEDECINLSECSMKQFYDELQKKHIGHLQKIPLLLMHLLCVWCDDTQLGDSMCDVFCDIIKLNLSRAEKKDENLFQDEGKGVVNKTIQDLFDSKYHSTIQALAKLAFNTLFDAHRERSLLFSRSESIKTLGETVFQSVLKSGLLTQRKVVRKLTRRESEVSFPHKTFQEFFAAVHICLESGKLEMQQSLLTMCSTINTMLEFSKVFIFLSGLSPATASEIFSKLQPAIKASKERKMYLAHGSLLKYWEDVAPLKDLQDMFLSCQMEYEDRKQCSNETFSVSVCDVFIDDTNKINQAFWNLTSDTSFANTLHINDVNTDEDFKNVLSKMPANFLSQLKRLDIWAIASETEIDHLFTCAKETLNILIFHSGCWKSMRWVEHYVPLSEKAFNAMCLMMNLETLSLWDLHLTHNQLVELSSSLEKKTCIKQIGLGDIHCLDHGVSCKELSLDLSKQTSLKILQVNLLPYSHVMVPVSIEDCVLGAFFESCILKTLFEGLQRSTMLRAFCCFELKSEQDIDLMISAIPTLRALETLILQRTDLGDKILTISKEMLSLSVIKLKRVRLSVKCLKTLTEQISDFHQPITIELVGCEVTTSDDFEQFKVDIMASRTFNVIENSIDQYKRSRFVFQRRK